MLEIKKCHSPENETLNNIALYHRNKSKTSFWISLVLRRIPVCVGTSMN